MQPDGRATPRTRCTRARCFSRRIKIDALRDEAPSLSRALVIALKWCVRLAKLARTAHCAGGGMLVNYLERGVLRARKSATAQTTRHHVMREPIACSSIAFNPLRKTQHPLRILT